MANLGKPCNKKNGKKGGHCPLSATPPLNGQKGDICCLKKERKSRQMHFRDKTAYVWGLRYRWDPLLSMNLICRFAHFMPPWPMGFSWFQVGFSWFHGCRSISFNSRLFFLVFHDSRSGFWGFRLVFMVFMINHGSRSVFHDWFLWLFMVPGWFISELSAGGAKWDVENTQKVPA